MSRPRWARGRRTCSPTDNVTGRPDAWISWASWHPVAAAPTTRTPASGSSSGPRYVNGVTDRTPAGRPSAAAGTVATLHAPVASTTDRACQAPWSVATVKPSAAGRTEVTVTPACTGASTRTA